MGFSIRESVVFEERDSSVIANCRTLVSQIQLGSLPCFNGTFFWAAHFRIAISFAGPFGRCWLSYGVRCTFSSKPLIFSHLADLFLKTHLEFTLLSTQLTKSRLRIAQVTKIDNVSNLTLTLFLPPAATTPLPLSAVRETPASHLPNIYILVQYF